VAGEKIYVVNNTELKSGPLTIGRVTAGNILTIEDVRGGWYQVHHKAVAARGWIPRQDALAVQAAFDQFTQTIQTRPTAFAYVGRALIWKDRGEIAQALSDLDAAVAVEPQNAFAFHTRGVLWMKQHQWSRSIPDFDETLRLSFDPIVQSSAHHNRGIAWMRLKEFDKAIPDFDACIRLSSLNQADAFANRGEARNFRRGNLDLALADLTEALRQNPKHEKAWSMRATNYELRGDWDQALADFSQALLLDPKNVAAIDNRGCIWEKKGDLDQALSDFSAAIQLDPKFAPPFGDRARVLEYKGEIERAEADLNEFVRLSENQDRVLALVLRASFYARQESVARASTDINAALATVDHMKAEPLTKLAFFLATCPKVELRNGPVAVELAGKACEATRFSNPEMLDVLAAAYAASGDFDQAVQTEKRALALSDDTTQKLAFEEKISRYANNELR